MTKRRKATREMLGLTRAEFATLRRLRTPRKIQEFLYRLKQNFERKGETCHSVRVVLRERRAHCIEGAMFAACALWVNGDPPLVMHLDCHESDYPHVIALFKRLVDALEATRHYKLMSPAQARSLIRRDPFEREVGNLLQYKRPKKR